MHTLYRSLAPSRASDAFQSRIEFEIVDGGAWSICCRDVQDERRSMGTALECEFYRRGTSLTLLQSWAGNPGLEGGAKDTTAKFVERMARATRNVRVVLYGRPSKPRPLPRSEDVIENGAKQLGCELEIREPIIQGFRRPRSGLHFPKDTFKARCEMDVTGDLGELTAFVNDWQATESEDSGMWDFEVFLSPDNKSATLLQTFADTLTRQRQVFRWKEHHAVRFSSLLRVKSLCIYGDASDELKANVSTGPLFKGVDVEYKDRVRMPRFQR